MATVKTLLDPKLAKEIAKGVLHGFENMLENVPAFEKYFAPNIQFSMNDVLVARSLKDYNERHNKFAHFFSSVKCHLLQEPLISGNNVIIRYNAECLDKQNKKHLLNFIAILTIHDDKVTHFSGVWNEKGSPLDAHFNRK